MSFWTVPTIKSYTCIIQMFHLRILMGSSPSNKLVHIQNWDSTILHCFFGWVDPKILMKTDQISTKGLLGAFIGEAWPFLLGNNFLSWTPLEPLRFEIYPEDLLKPSGSPKKPPCGHVRPFRWDRSPKKMEKIGSDEKSLMCLPFFSPIIMVQWKMCPKMKGLKHLTLETSRFCSSMMVGGRVIIVSSILFFKVFRPRSVSSLKGSKWLNSSLIFCFGNPYIHRWAGDPGWVLGLFLVFFWLKQGLFAAFLFLPVAFVGPAVSHGVSTLRHAGAKGGAMNSNKQWCFKSLLILQGFHYQSPSICWPASFIGSMVSFFSPLFFWKTCV